MAQVRLLVGTRKGAFVMTADGARRNWTIDGPHFAGWEIYHLKGSAADPNRIYASQSNSWFGQLVQRSDDGGASWNPVGNKFAYDGVAGTHQWYDGTPHPWEFKRVWHLEPSLADPDEVLAGVEDAGLFRSTDGGQSWGELSGLRTHTTGSALAAGRGRTVPAHHPAGPDQPAAHGDCDFVGGGVPQRRRRRHLEADQPRPAVAAHSRPGGGGGPLRASHCGASQPAGVLFMQKHWDVMRSDDAGDHWVEVSRQPAHRLRLRHRRARARAGDAVRGADQERLRALCPRRPVARLPQPDRRQPVGAAEQRSPADRNCYVNVLRDAMAVDRLDACGVYFGTSGGQVYASADAGDSWTAIVRDLPPVLSVEVQTLP